MILSSMAPTPWFTVSVPTIMNHDRPQTMWDGRRRAQLPAPVGVTRSSIEACGASVAV